MDEGSRGKKSDADAVIKKKDFERKTSCLKRVQWKVQIRGKGRSEGQEGEGGKRKNHKNIINSLSKEEER